MRELITILRPLMVKHNIVAAYLFGSRATGQVHPGSDYDLAVLFKDYDPGKHNLAFRLNLAEEISQLVGTQVDLIFLQNVPILMRYEIVATGKVVYCTDDDFRTDFEDIAFRDYLDFRPFIEQFYREAGEAVRDGHFFVES